MTGLYPWCVWGVDVFGGRAVLTGAVVAEGREDAARIVGEVLDGPDGDGIMAGAGMVRREGAVVRDAFALGVLAGVLRANGYAVTAPPPP